MFPIVSIHIFQYDVDENIRRNRSNSMEKTNHIISDLFLDKSSQVRYYCARYNLCCTCGSRCVVIPTTMMIKRLEKENKKMTHSHM